MDSHSTVSLKTIARKKVESFDEVCFPARSPMVHRLIVEHGLWEAELHSHESHESQCAKVMMGVDGKYPSLTLAILASFRDNHWGVDSKSALDD